MSWILQALICATLLEIKATSQTFSKYDKHIFVLTFMALLVAIPADRWAFRTNKKGTKTSYKTC